MATDRIRTEEPVKNTIHNLVHSFENCAELFAEIAEVQQRQIQGLVRCLKQHIGEPPGAGE